jgi:hypothetical protein
MTTFDELVGRASDQLLQKLIQALFCGDRHDARVG